MPVIGPLLAVELGIPGVNMCVGKLQGYSGCVC